MLPDSAEQRLDLREELVPEPFPLLIVEVGGTVHLVPGRAEKGDLHRRLARIAAKTSSAGMSSALPSFSSR